MAMYYSQTTFSHVVTYSAWMVGPADAFVRQNARLQKWLDTWGVLALPHIGAFQIYVSERRGDGVGYDHSMHVDLRNVDEPVRTDFTCSGEWCLSSEDPLMFDAHLEDINALVRSLLITLPNGEKALIAERFRAMMKGLWHSYACVGGSDAPHRFSVISKKSMAYGFAAKTAKEWERVVARLLATGA